MVRRMGTTLYQSPPPSRRIPFRQPAQRKRGLPGLSSGDFRKTHNGKQFSFIRQRCKTRIYNQQKLIRNKQNLINQSGSGKIHSIIQKTCRNNSFTQYRQQFNFYIQQKFKHRKFICIQQKFIFSEQKLQFSNTLKL